MMIWCASPIRRMWPPKWGGGSRSSRGPAKFAHRTKSAMAELSANSRALASTTIRLGRSARVGASAASSAGDALKSSSPAMLIVMVPSLSAETSYVTRTGYDVSPDPTPTVLFADQAGIRCGFAYERARRMARYPRR